MSSIDAFQQTTTQYATGAQPAAAQIAELEAAGFEAVLNLSPTSTPNFLAEEAALVENSSMAYVHYPIDCSVLYPWQYEIFAGALKSLGDRKVFIHCGGNVKSSGMLHLYRVKELGDRKVDSEAALKELGRHDQKWYDYFEAMGV